MDKRTIVKTVFKFIVDSVMLSSSSVQDFYNSICAIKSTTLPEMKHPQLRKPKVTVARNPNSIDERKGEKNYFGETRLSRGDRSA